MIALFRTELVKATVRVRTLIVAAILVALPVLISVAIHARKGRGPAREGLGVLARQSGLLMPAAILGFTSAFLLIIIAGTFAGDAVAGDAASGNLRYVLIRPVSRGRLLIAKLAAAGVLVWAMTLLVACVGLVAGLALFGSHPAIVPSLAGGSLHTFTLGTGTQLVRVGIATLYIAAGFTGLLAIGTFFSTLTDTPAGAIGACVGVYIVSEILDGIDQLGRLRYVLPTHYRAAWEPLFTENRFSHDLLTGLLVQAAYLVVFLGAAVIWFRRKDIRS
ncbi:MAG: ABC transporter permease subunit [Actinomycetes bacterium]